MMLVDVDDVPFQLLNNLRVDEQRRFWIVNLETDEDACDIREVLGQGVMEVKIAFPMSHNILTRTEEYVQRGYRTLKARSPSWN